MMNMREAVFEAIKGTLPGESCHITVHEGFCKAKLSDDGNEVEDCTCAVQVLHHGHDLEDCDAAQEG